MIAAAAAATLTEINRGINELGVMQKKNKKIKNAFLAPAFRANRCDSFCSSRVGTRAAPLRYIASSNLPRIKDREIKQKYVNLHARLEERKKKDKSCSYIHAFVRNLCV